MGNLDLDLDLDMIHSLTHLSTHLFMYASTLEMKLTLQT